MLRMLSYIEGGQQGRKKINAWRMMSLDPRVWRCLPETLKTSWTCRDGRCGSGQGQFFGALSKENWSCLGPVFIVLAPKLLRTSTTASTGPTERDTIS